MTAYIERIHGVPPENPSSIVKGRVAGWGLGVRLLVKSHCRLLETIAKLDGCPFKVQYC